MHRSLVRPSLHVILVLFGLAALAPRPLAQLFHYGLTDRGRLVVDGVLLDKLPSSYDPGDNSDFGERWLDLYVQDSDRYAIRLDGLVFANGAKLWNLPAFGFNYWIGITGGLDGVEPHVWALRNDGVLAKDGEVIAVLPLCQTCGGFADLVSDGSKVWSLRTDGAVFEDTIATPVFQFVGGDGVNGNPDGTIGDASTWWTRLALGDDTLYALRQDGVVFSGALPGGDPAGAEQTNLAGPPAGPSSLLTGNLYVDLTLDDTGAWLALRGDGAVFRSDNTVTPLLDYKGDPIGNGSNSQLYFALEATTGEIGGLRFDGKLFTDADPEEPLVDFGNERYFVLEVSDDPPDLSNIKNGKPRGAKYKAFALAGDAVELPLLVTDTDKAAEDLVVSVVEPLPEGAVWNATTRALEWASAPLGNHKATLLVDDGVAKPVKVKQKLKVLEPDDDPDKNKPPLITKLNSLQGLVGVPLVIPILAVDPDGDALSIEVVDDFGVFGLDETDAAFDAKANSFSWTPRFEDIGKQKARFLISDGQKTKKLNIKIKVVNSLILTGV